MDQAEFEFLQELRNPVTSKAMNEWLDDKLASREKEGLSLVNKQLRDVHRFGFPSLAKLAAAGGKFFDEAVGMIRAYPEVAQYGA